MNKRIEQGTNRLIADADKIIQNGVKYKSYYIINNKLTSSVWGILAHNIAVFMGTHYNAKLYIDKLEADND